MTRLCCVIGAMVLLGGLVLSQTQPTATVGDDRTFFITFPIPNRTAWSATINSIMDHSMGANAYVPTGKPTVAFSGEQGVSATNCAAVKVTDRITLAQKRRDNSQPFILNGEGADSCVAYEAHPGIDFKTTDQDSGMGLPIGMYTLANTRDVISVRTTANGSTSYACTPGARRPNCDKGHVAVFAAFDGTIDNTCFQDCAEGSAQNAFRIKSDFNNGELTAIYLHTEQPEGAAFIF